MEALTFSFYTDFSSDPEQRIYAFRHAMQTVALSFRKNALYPYLTQLIELHSQLETFLERYDAFERNQPKTLTAVDLVRNELTYEAHFVDTGMQKTVAFIREALPFIRQNIEEGAAIYEFVEQQLHFEPVGVVPNYRSEGYFMIQDTEADNVKVYRYGLSLLTSADQRFRSIRTNLVRTLTDAEKLIPPNTVKLQLIEEHTELPNPAIFQFRSEMDFPFSATLFPVCRRLLLRQVG
jgi:hypothetical protein